MTMWVVDGGGYVHGTAGKVRAGVRVNGTDGGTFEYRVKVLAKGADDGPVGGVVRDSGRKVRGEWFDAIDRPEAVKAPVFEDTVAGVSVEGEPEGVGKGEDAVERPKCGVSGVDEGRTRSLVEETASGPGGGPPQEVGDHGGVGLH